MTGTAGQKVDLLYDECCGAPALLNAALPGETVPVPEPASLLLLGGCLLVVGRKLAARMAQS
jgi:hypothetical protein